MSHAPSTDGHPYRDIQSSVHVVYVQPSFEELKGRFPIGVDPNYKRRKFVPTDMCSGVSLQDRLVTFEYVHMGYTVFAHEVFTLMKRLCLRPALYEELLSFALKYPEEPHRFPIAALGSSTMVRDYRGYACVESSAEGKGRKLFMHDDFLIGAGWQFLAVRL